MTSVKAKAIYNPGRDQTSVWSRPVCFWRRYLSCRRLSRRGGNATLRILLGLSLAGCASPHPTASIATPAAQAVASSVSVGPDQIVIVFDLIECGCSLGEVDMALLQLPGVGRTRWNVDARTATLFFLDPQRPTDTTLRHLIEPHGLTIAQIVRPVEN